MCARACCVAAVAVALVCACDLESDACGPDVACPSGSYCFAGTCRTDCDPAAPACPVGVCTSDGRCARDQPDPGAGVCAARVIDARFGIPTVVLLVDQSGSMTTAYSGGTRWDVLRDALIDPDTGVVAQLQGSVRFGLTLYTNDGGPTCPALTTVPPALNNRDAIAAVYQAAQPEADTPTGEAIDAVVDELVAFGASGAKHIIVASDGEPDTCAVPNPQNGQPESVAAAQRSYAAGITLYFLSVGSGVVSGQHMQDMANAGVGNAIGGPENAPYYEAGDAQQLQAAFAEITGRLLTCELTVNGVIEPTAESSGVIYLDGNQLLLDDPNGWQAIDSTSFRLLGEACTRAQRAGTHTVTAEFGCADVRRTALRATGGGVIDRGCSAVAHGDRAGLLALLVVLGIVGLRGARRRGRRSEQ